ncbi:UDP-N-acetylmuramoyl-L-alanine--D-glutamate ligase [Microscilla marina]|uniref:UDP-N-acetylmuramoylalanine--D-glutamate ligase n=1 Tax=Microscilla marina ATCC 23134 TaxID=313606 RepID=A1ZYU8_MICM2|nr:UDP-N-acetylmuramoyl-L-alanine--D-glutamate ligase [Microscilla marina]EAY24445.1 UDP-N-acetylmuramoylalanine--D-glutamate ligase [Microscilla marina ATCC 23134]
MADNQTTTEEQNATKRIVILGGAESGVGSALLAKAKGFDVFVSDSSILQENYRKTLIDNDIAFEEQGHTEEFILIADEVIKSPGIPENASMVRKVTRQQIPIISEIEFAARYTKAKMIGITGSNGKSTTTLLTHHLLTQAGFKVGLAGNIGESFAKQVVDDAYDFFVVEVSSFQLDNCYEFRPHLSMLINITEDHMDRYENNINKYIASKFKVIQKQTPEDYFLYNIDDANVTERLQKITEGIVGVSEGEEPAPNRTLPYCLPISLKNADPEKAKEQSLSYWDEENGNIVLNFSDRGSDEQKTMTVPVADLPLPGKHNIFNAMIALQACHILGASPVVLHEGLKNFSNAPHRMEEVAELSEVKFINDSKSTNIDSAFYALDSIKMGEDERKLVWIAGGVDKGNDYEKIRDLVAKKVKILICLGLDNEKLHNTFRETVHVTIRTQQINEAVEQAFDLARPGDTVLLSPACASYDLFKNYEERGDSFKKAVQKLVRLKSRKKKR